MVTTKSTLPVVNRQLGSFAFGASDKEDNISQLLGTDHFVVEVVMSLVGKAGRVVGGSGVLNNCADRLRN